MKIERLARFDEWIQSIRSFFAPSHYLSYLRSRQQRVSSSNYPGPVACYDFSSTSIDLDSGRYLFHMVCDFLQTGYRPVYRDRFRFLATLQRKLYKKRLLDFPFATYHNLDEVPRPYVLLTDSWKTPAGDAQKTIRIDYAERRPSKPHEIALPYFAHPTIQAKHEFSPPTDPAAERPVRIFFAGNTRAKKYSAGPVKEKYLMMPRNQVLQHVRNHLAPADIRVPTSNSELARIDRTTFFCAEGRHFRIPFENWLATMRQADFFLACPGVAMPLCHNLLEALLCGTVPILEYHRYLHPALEHGKNCLTYHDRASLIEAINQAIAMPSDQVIALRRGAYDYFQQNCLRGQFVRKLLDNPASEVTLLFNACRTPILAP